MVDFRDEMRHQVMRLHLGAEFVAAARIDIVAALAISVSPLISAVDSFTAIDFGQRPVDGQIVTVGRGAENAFHRMLEESTVARPRWR